MDQWQSRLKLSENFEHHWSILILGEIHVDQSLVHMNLLGKFVWTNGSESSSKVSPYTGINKNGSKIGSGATFESILGHFWGRSARVTLEWLLGHFNSFCVSLPLGARPLHKTSFGCGLTIVFEFFACN